MKTIIKKRRLGIDPGFTLMELMLVVAIIGIMAAVSLPIILNMIPDMRLRAATRDIVSCLQEARLRAIKENDTVVIVFDLPNNRYTAFVDNGSGGGTGGNRARDGSEPIVVQGNLPVGVDLYYLKFGSNTFVGYNSRGLPATTVGRLRLKNAYSNYRQIIINPVGNIRVQKSSDEIKCSDGTNWN